MRDFQTKFRLTSANRSINQYTPHNYVNLTNENDRNSTVIV